MAKRDDRGIHFCLTKIILHPFIWEFMINNTKGPLTAVPMVSLAVLPNCPSFYTRFLWV